MIRNEKKYTDALNNILEKTDYVFYMKILRSYGDFIDPWFDFETMKRAIEGSGAEKTNAIKLLAMGIKCKEEDLTAELGEKPVEMMKEAGIWRSEEGYINTENLVVAYYQGLKLLVDVNPWFETCTKKNTDVYIGSDSLRLAENIVFRKGTEVLDLCSGSGIQGLLAAKSAKKVVSVELNGKAAPVTLFNIRLNEMEDVVDLRTGDLYSVLKEGETFDYIYANPPFIPMLDTVEYPMCGGGGEDGLMVLRNIFNGLDKYLKKDGSAIIFCECLGDTENVFFDSEVAEKGKEQGWKIISAQSGRIEANHQINQLASLTALFNENFDREDFIKRMTDIYSRLSATFLYNMVYKIRAGENGNGKITRIRQFNPWDINNKADVPETLTAEPVKDMVSVYNGRVRINIVNDETWDVIEHLRKGLSVSEIAKELYPKYKSKKKYTNVNEYGYAQNLINLCMTLENQKMIKRK